VNHRKEPHFFKESKKIPKANKAINFKTRAIATIFKGGWALTTIKLNH